MWDCPLQLVSNLHVLLPDSSETDPIRPLRKNSLKVLWFIYSVANLSTHSCVARMLEFILAVTKKASEQRQELNLQDVLCSKSQQSEKVDLKTKTKTKELCPAPHHSGAHSTGRRQAKRKRGVSYSRAQSCPPGQMANHISCDAWSYLVTIPCFFSPSHSVYFWARAHGQIPSLVTFCW